MSSMIKMSLIAAATSLALVGCGGGGGGSSSANALSVSSKSLVVSGYGSDTKTASVNVAVRVGQDDPLYIGAYEIGNSIIENFELVATGATTGRVDVNFIPNYEIGEGETKTQMVFALCKDEWCDEHYSGSPAYIDIAVNVEMNETFTSLDSDPIQISAKQSYGSAAIKTDWLARLQGPDYGVKVFATVPYDSSVEDVSVAALGGGEEQALNVVFKSPQALTVGQHPETIVLNACYDFDCDYPVEGSPILLPVQYEVTPGDPAVVAETLIADKVAQFDANIEFLEYNAQADLLALIDSALNRLYLISLSDGSSQTFPLALSPTDLDIAISGNTVRVYVADNDMVRIYTKSSDSGQFTDSFDVRHGQIHNLMAYGDYVWLFGDAENGNDKIVTLNAATTSFTNTEIAGTLGGQLKTEVVSTGDKAYISNTFNELGYIDLSNPNKPELFSHRVVNFSDCGDLWLTKSDDMLYTPCSKRFWATDDARFDRKYAGGIPKSDPNSNANLNVLSIDGAHASNKIAVTDDVTQFDEVPTIRELDVTTSQELNRYTLDQIQIDQTTMNLRPKYAFYDKQDKLVVVAYSSDTFGYYIVRQK